MSTKNQSLVLYILLGVAALFIMILSIFLESRAQINARLGLASPTPLVDAPEILVVSPQFPSAYRLPEPGILPNHPLYPLKMIRDRIILISTLNPSKKPKLLLNFANRRIAATQALINAGYAAEAVGTAMKAESYLEQAVGLSDQVEPSQRRQWLENLDQAALMHSEVIDNLRLNLTDKTQADMLSERLNCLSTKIKSL